MLLHFFTALQPCKHMHHGIKYWIAYFSSCGAQRQTSYAAGSRARNAEEESPSQARIRAAMAATAASGQALQERGSSLRSSSPARLAASQQKV